MSENENEKPPRAFDDVFFPYLNIRPVFPDFKTLEEALEHLEKTEDERALVIVGALLLERAIDELLSAYIPGYEELSEDRDFSFSMKIKIAKAVNICPLELLKGADVVREVRNAFAHDLSVVTLSKVLKKNKNLTEALRYRIRQCANIEKGYEIVGFRIYIHFLVKQIYFYRLQAWLINEFIRSEHLLPALQKFCKTQDVDLNRLAKA